MSDEHLSEIRELRERVRQLEADYDQALTELNNQLAANEQLQSQLAEHEELFAAAASEIDSLKVQHEFEKIADRLGVAPEWRGDFLKLAPAFESDPESEGVDPAAVEQHYKAFMDANPRFSAGAVKTSEAPAKPARPARLSADENGSRGRSSSPRDGKIYATAQQLNDHEWMEKNMAAIEGEHDRRFRDCRVKP